MTATQYEYRFVRYPVTRTRGRINSQDYQDAIQQHAREGWRLVQILVEEPAATVTTYELVLERPVVPEGS